MIVSITNRIRGELITLLPDVRIYDSIDDEITSFPCIVLEENTNMENLATRTSGGNQHTQSIIEINVFTTGNTKKSDALDIADSIDDLLSGEYRLPRIMGEPIANLDKSIYRYITRYSFLIGNDYKVYRG